MGIQAVWHVYLLECRDGSLYCGITTDVEARLKAHREGKGARYTRSHPVARLIGSIPVGSRADALRVELKIKRLPKHRKAAAVKGLPLPEIQEKALSVIDQAIVTAANDVARNLADIGIHLDGSEASLKILDEAIATIWGDSSPPEDIFDGMVWGYGCYVADVVQRHHAGAWQSSDDIGYDFALTAEAMVINPWAWVEKRFQVGDAIAAQYGRVRENSGGA